MIYSTDRYIPYLRTTPPVDFSQEMTGQEMTGQEMTGLARRDLSDCYNRNIIADEHYSDVLHEACFGSERGAKEPSLFAYPTVPAPTRKATAAPIQKPTFLVDPTDRYQMLYERCRPALATSQRLAAPNLQEDFYKNLLDAPKTGPNKLAVGLGYYAYIYHPTSNKTEVAYQPQETSIPPLVSCVRWLNPSKLFVTLSNSKACHIDCVLRSTLRQYEFACGEISCAAPLSEQTLLLGETQGLILHVDQREQSTPARAIAKHKGQICALKEHSDGMQIACGSNDNMIKIWDLRNYQSPVHTFDNIHTAAVKALSWAPWKSDLLFSGGGTADRTIKAISLNREGVVAVDTSIDRQVTAVFASTFDHELVSCHGYNANMVLHWKYNNHRFIPMRAAIEHKDRILYSTILPDGTTLATASAGVDQSLRIWDVFSAPKSIKKATSSFSTLSLR